MAIQISGVTVIDDGRGLDNITSLDATTISTIESSIDAITPDDTQSTATWETGTSTTEGIVSPAKVKAAIEALAGVTTTAGAVGTYCFAVGLGADVAFGGTIAGSSLRPTSAVYAGVSGRGSPGRGTTFDQGTALSGTWRAMGTYDYIENVGSGPDPSYIFGVTLWLRIS